MQRNSRDQDDSSDSSEEQEVAPSQDGPLSWPAYLRLTLYELFMTRYTNLLFLVSPLAVMSNIYKWGDGYQFCFSLIVLVPLAERVSFVTEDVAKYTNETLGGLLNATFGNVTELVLCIFALRKGLNRVVQVSMLGSVLSNSLLVLGSAFFVGGIKHREQSFNQVSAATYSSLLIMGVLALSLPSVLDATHSGRAHTGRNSTEFTGDTWMQGNGHLQDESAPGGDAPVWLSLFISVAMLLLYGLLIIFQLFTHTYLFDEQPSEVASPSNQDSKPIALIDPESSQSKITHSVSGRTIRTSSEDAAMWAVGAGVGASGNRPHFPSDAAEDDDDGPPILGLWGGIFWLAVITVLISVLSEAIVNTITGAATELKVPILFISGILVPIVGNAAEHAAAVIFAYRNKMEIAINSAVGSAVQISILVIPLTVVIGFTFNRLGMVDCSLDGPRQKCPEMTLNFHIFETATLLLVSVAVGFVLMDGRSHWLKGATLIIAYGIVSCAFWAHADPRKMD